MVRALFVLLCVAYSSTGLAVLPLAGHPSAFLSYAEFQNLPDTKKTKYLNAIRNFLAQEENGHPNSYFDNKVASAFGFFIDTAEASNSGLCIAAGNLTASLNSDNNLCSLSQTTRAVYARYGSDYVKCQRGSIPCNPLYFGFKDSSHYNCVDISGGKDAEPNQATHNCIQQNPDVKALAQKYANNPKAAAEFDEGTAAMGTFCDHTGPGIKKKLCDPLSELASNIRREESNAKAQIQANAEVDQVKKDEAAKAQAKADAEERARAKAKAESVASPCTSDSNWKTYCAAYAADSNSAQTPRHYDFKQDKKGSCFDADGAVHCNLTPDQLKNLGSYGDGAAWAVLDRPSKLGKAEVHPLLNKSVSDDIFDAWKQDNNGQIKFPDVRALAKRLEDQCKIKAQGAEKSSEYQVVRVDEYRFQPITQLYVCERVDKHGKIREHLEGGPFIRLSPGSDGYVEVGGLDPNSAGLSSDGSALDSKIYRTGEVQAYLHRQISDSSKKQLFYNVDTYPDQNSCQKGNPYNLVRMNPNGDKLAVCQSSSTSTDNMSVFGGPVAASADSDNRYSAPLSACGVTGEIRVKKDDKGACIYSIKGVGGEYLGVDVKGFTPAGPKNDTVPKLKGSTTVTTMN